MTVKVMQTKEVTKKIFNKEESYEKINDER